MKAFIATLIIMIGIFGCSSTGMKQNKQAQEDFAWLEMCQLLEDETDYACMRLMPPLVEYEDMEPGLLGWYGGGDTIYIANGVGDRRVEILIHEGIHYVHVQHGFIIVPGPAEQVCWSENEAWMLTGIYYNEDNSTWWRAYPHCWQWYADTEYLQDVGYIYNEIESIIDGIIFED